MGGLFKFFWALLLWSGNPAIVQDYVGAEIKHQHFFFVSAWIPVENHHCNRYNLNRPNGFENTSSHRYIQLSLATVGSNEERDEHTTTASTSPPNNEDSLQAITKNQPSSAKRISMPVSKRKWQVWKTIDRLQEVLDESKDSFPLYPASRELVAEIVSILTALATQHEGSIEWQGLLNKSTLLHEVEESILAIYLLQQEWKNRPNSQRTVVLVDVCCGKGVFSLLASHVFANHRNNSISVAKIIMLDKDPKLRWDHIYASNMDSTSNTDDGQRPWIECWPRFNLHDMDEVVQRLETQLDGISNAELALVGIHLCKTLSPACIGIANLLGPQKCPHLVLAPCCLPRVVVQSKYNHKPNSPKVLEVRQYETEQQSQERRLAQERRAMAMVRGKASMGGACWKRGEFGHVKADCPSNQSTSKPSLVKPPKMELDVSGILGKEQPFGSYCHLLSTSIQRQTVVVQETGLTNNHMLGAKQKQANNWNRDRKSMYIVASESHSSI